MWQRFTENARKTVFWAQDEAGNLHDDQVCTGHLLLGLLRQKDCRASQALIRMGVEPAAVAEEVHKVLQPLGEERLEGDFQLTNLAKRVIDLAYDEARNMNDHYIRTEHLLLGIIREDVGAGRVLVRLGADLERTRAAVRELQAESGIRPDDAGPDGKGGA